MVASHENHFATYSVADQIISDIGGMYSTREGDKKSILNFTRKS
jgi:hypothetical protein